MGEVLKEKCPTIKQGNIIETGIENQQTILLKNTKYKSQGISVIKTKLNWDFWKKTLTEAECLT